MEHDTTTVDREFGGITDAVRQAHQSHTAFVDKQLSELEPGQTLCVHEVTDFGDTYTVTWRLHVLAATEECDSPQRRQQYGPAPANWRSIVDGYRIGVEQ